MNQNYLQDPLIFIRIQMENAWDDGDLENALRLSRMIDESALTEAAAEPAPKAPRLTQTIHKIYNEIICEGGGFSEEKPPPSRSLPKRLRWGDSGGEAASLREAPLPQTPSPEERLAFGRAASAYLVPPECAVVLR